MFVCVRVCVCIYIYIYIYKMRFQILKKIICLTVNVIDDLSY